MAFNKFDPHAPQQEDDVVPEASRRRVWILKYGWWITVAYTAMGFAFMAVFWLKGNPF